MWGDEITVYGYGFNQNSTIKFNGVNIIPGYIGEDRLKFTVPDRAVDGNLQVVTDGNISNSVKFQIRNNSFNIYPSTKHLNMVKGEDYNGSLHVYGYSDYVSLSVETDSDYISASLSSDHIVPNGSVDLDISLLDSTPSGTYRVTFSGDSSGVKKDEELTIYVGDNVSLIKKSLKSGKVATPYSDTLDVENNLYDLRFVLDGDNKLPKGLLLNPETGEIYGTPEVPGRYLFNVKVYDGSKRSNTRAYTITVEDSGWFKEEGPGGNNRFTGTPSTAEDRVKWISEENSNSNSLLSSGETIYSVSPTRVSLIKKGSGTVDTRLNIPNRKVEIESGYILAISDSDFVINDKENELARFTGINNFKVSAGYIYLLDDSNSVTRVSIKTLEREDVTGSTIFDSGSVVTEDGVYRKSSDTAFVTSYGGDVVKLTNGGRYIDGSKSLETGVLNGKIAVGDQFSVVYNSRGLIIINRDNLRFLYKDMDVEQLLLTGDKLFVLNSRGIVSTNLYSGDDIWSSNGIYHSLISSGKDIYVLDQGGRTVCFSGRVNVEPPVSTVVLDPPEPNGDNGYYKVKPTLRVDVSDRESYGEANYTFNDSKKWRGITEPITIQDGDTNFNYRSIDNLGLKEDVRTQNIKVDSIAPETTATVLDHITKKVLKLESVDDGSGVAKIEYSVNGGEYTEYSSEVEFSSGSYLIYYRAIDSAGNVEDERSVTIDLSDSLSTITSYIEPKFNQYNNTLTLRVTDSTKISKVEYSLDSTGIYQYKNALRFSRGLHTIFYRGVDTLNKKGSWAAYSFEVKGDSQPISKLKSYTGDIPILLDVKDNLEPFKAIKLYIKELPGYLKGSKLLQTTVDDGDVDGRYLEFRTTEELYIYVVKVRESKEDYYGFNRVEDNYFLDPESLFGNVEILKKKYYKGDLVEIPGANTGTKDRNNLIFIKKSNDKQFSIDILDRVAEARVFSSNYKSPTWSLIVDGERKEVGDGLRVDIPKVDANRFELEFRVEINGKEYIDSYPVTSKKGGSK